MALAQASGDSGAADPLERLRERARALRTEDREHAITGTELP